MSNSPSDCRWHRDGNCLLLVSTAMGRMRRTWKVMRPPPPTTRTAWTEVDLTEEMIAADRHSRIRAMENWRSMMLSMSMTRKMAFEKGMLSIQTYGRRDSQSSRRGAASCRERATIFDPRREREREQRLHHSLSSECAC